MGTKLTTGACSLMAECIYCIQKACHHPLLGSSPAGEASRQKWGIRDGRKVLGIQGGLSPPHHHLPFPESQWTQELHCWKSPLESWAGGAYSQSYEQQKGDLFLVAPLGFLKSCCLSSLTPKSGTSLLFLCWILGMGEQLKIPRKRLFYQERKLERQRQ